LAGEISECVCHDSKGKFTAGEFHSMSEYDKFSGLGIGSYRLGHQSALADTRLTVDED